MAQTTTTRKTMAALLKVQEQLKAPKDKRNNFGGYSYRSCDDILQAVKPLLAENKLLLTLSDEIRLIGAHYYVVASAMVTLIDSDEQSIAVEGWAREPEGRKGLDEAQITGSSSSYARKYALNGLFCIDDSKDPDQQQPQQAAPQQQSAAPTIDDALKEGDTVNGRLALNAYWQNYPQYQNDPRFIKKIEELGRKFPKK